MVLAIAARKPVESHCAVSWLSENAVMMLGMATFTMVVASTMEAVPSIMLPVAYQR